MLTNESFQDFLETLHITEIQDALDSDGDYITLETHIFNSGGYATIESKNFNTDDSINDTCLHCDKDDFLRLCEELAPDIFNQLD